jgi:hypothetical protein
MSEKGGWGVFSVHVSENPPCILSIKANGTYSGYMSSFLRISRVGLVYARARRGLKENEAIRRGE